MTHKLDQLTKITDALYHVDLAKLKSVSAEEAEIREKLSTLDAQEKEAAVQAESNAISLGAIGADILWQAWVERKRKSLLMTLANILVRKSHAKDALRRTFGKNAVAEKLRIHAALKHHQKSVAKTLSQEQEQIVLNAGRTRI